MTATISPAAAEALRRTLAQELLRHGPEMGAGRQQDADDLADEWASVGCDLGELREALDAGCWEPSAWRGLRDAGLDAREIGRRITVPQGDYEATIGYAVSNGDLTAEDAAVAVRVGIEEPVIHYDGGEQSVWLDDRLRVTVEITRERVRDVTDHPPEDMRPEQWVSLEHVEETRYGPLGEFRGSRSCPDDGTWADQIATDEPASDSELREALREATAETVGRMREIITGDDR